MDFIVALFEVFAIFIVIAIVCAVVSTHIDNKGNEAVRKSRAEQKERLGL